MLTAYQKFKNINHQLLNKDILDSPLYMEPATSADSLPVQCNHVMHQLVDTHALEQTKLVAARLRSVPRITDDIKAAKTERRSLERKWCSSQLTVHCHMFIHQRDTTATMCKAGQGDILQGQDRGLWPRSEEAIPPADGRAPSKSRDNTARSQLLS